MSLPGFETRTKTTAVIDLHQQQDDIFSHFNDTTRNEIRKTYNISDFKVVSLDRNFDEAYILYKKFEYKQGRVPFTRNDLKDCLIFSAYLKGDMISAIFVDKGVNDLRIRYIFSKRLQTEDKELYKMIAYATRRVMWEVCIWGKANHFHSLDLASINFQNPDVANITQFKMSFGGEVVNEYTYVYKSFLFKIFEKLAGPKNYIKKLFH